MDSIASTSGAEDPCMHIGGDIHTILGLRLAALFSILGTSSIGIALPYFLNVNRWAKPLFVIKVFAAGIVLATGFAHVLPDAIDVLSNPCLGFSSSFPWATTFAGAAALLTFVLEFGLQKIIHRNYERAAALRRVRELAAREIETGEFFSREADEKDLAQQEANVTALVLEAGIIFHSIFIGLTIGINMDPAVVRPLMLALMFHQGFEGTALGTVFVKAEYSRRKYLLLAAAFVLTTPIGVAIGIVSNNRYNANGVSELAIQGAFNSASAGILIYNALVDLIIPAFSGREMPTEHIWQFTGILFMFAGYVCMAMLAKWA